MVFRRYKGLWQAFLLLIFVGVTLRFSYNYYKENEIKLKAAKVRHHELLDERNRLSRDLDGVMESKNNLEYSLRIKAQQFKKLKEEWDVEKRNLENQANKDKANVDALDSEHRMLKSKHDDLQIDYEHMKKNFDRLKEDHTKLDTEHRNNYAELKKKEEKIISALQKQLEHYQKQENSLQIKVQELEETIAQYQAVVAKLQVQVKESAKKHVLEVKHDQIVPKAGLGSLHSKRRRKIVAKESDPKLDAKNNLNRIEDLVSKSNKNLKHEQFLQDLRKSREERKQTQEKKNEVKLTDKNDGNVVVPPKAGEYTLDVIGNKDEEKKDVVDETVGNKNEIADKIEVISENGKEEKNFKLDEQRDEESKEIQAVGEENNAEDKLVREKREADERLNNDQKFDDQEVALQEGGDANEDNVGDENEESEMLNKPENLLMHGEEKSQQEEQERDEQLF